MGARIGIGVGAAGRGPADPRPVTDRGQRRADIDHVPAGAEAEDQHHADEGGPVPEQRQEHRQPLLRPVQSDVERGESAMGQHDVWSRRRRRMCGSAAALCAGPFLPPACPEASRVPPPAHPAGFDRTALRQARLRPAALRISWATRFKASRVWSDMRLVEACWVLSPGAACRSVLGAQRGEALLLGDLHRVGLQAGDRRDVHVGVHDGHERMPHRARQSGRRWCPPPSAGCRRCRARRRRRTCR